MEASRRRAVPEQSGHCPGEVTLGRSSSGRAVTSDDSQDADSCRPGPGRPPAGRAEGTARRFTHMPMSGRCGPVYLCTCMYVANSSGVRTFSLVIRAERRACRFRAASPFVTWLDCLSLGSAMRVDDRFLCDGSYARCAGLTCRCVGPLAGPYTWCASAGPAMLCRGWTGRRPAGHPPCSPSWHTVPQRGGTGRRAGRGRQYAGQSGWRWLTSRPGRVARARRRVMRQPSLSSGRGARVR